MQRNQKIVGPLGRNVNTETVSRDMSPFRSLLLAVLCGTGAPQSAFGQRLSDAHVGSRVRLDRASGSLVTGTLVSVEADTIRLELSRGGATLAVPRGEITSVEVSAGHERGRGARRGAIVGGAAGLALVGASLRRDTNTVNRQPSDVRWAVSAGVGLLALGAGIGAALAPERWESLGGAVAGARVRMAACPGQCLGFRVRF